MKAKTGKVIPKALTRKAENLDAIPRSSKDDLILLETFDGGVFPPTDWTVDVTNDATTWVLDAESGADDLFCVTIAYDGLGQVVSFNGMPLGAFGPESVLNML